MAADPESAAEFARAFRDFLEWVHEAPSASSNPVVALVTDHLGGSVGAAGPTADTGTDGRGPVATHPVVGRDVPPWDHVNLQVALDAWSAAPGREVAVHGLSVPMHHELPSLQDILLGTAHLQLRPGPPTLVDRPRGPGRTLACLQAALLLVTDERGSYVLAVRGPERHRQPELTVEVAGLPVEAAQQVHAELADLRGSLSVYRGQVLELSDDEFGRPGLQFVELPATAREDVVLPEGVLARIERSTLGVAEHRDQLRAAGQHLKRGLLLYGPPGTGKTHTTRYVVGRLDGYTTLMLAGRSLGQIGAVAGIARSLAPAAVVLEDVDLVAEDRGFGPGPSPVLFELLDAMDGAAADADLVFLLTTNRADLLEPALAARPGRVDVAVEIGLPDEAARRRLFDLYARSVPLELAPGELETVVERTAGSTASLLRELVRRAVLEALRRDPVLATVTGADVTGALDDLLDSTQRVTRTLLGAGDGAGAGAGDAGAAAGVGRASAGHGALAEPTAEGGDSFGWYTSG